MESSASPQLQAVQRPGKARNPPKKKSPSCFSFQPKKNCAFSGGEVYDYNKKMNHLEVSSKMISKMNFPTAFGWYQLGGFDWNASKTLALLKIPWRAKHFLSIRQQAHLKHLNSRCCKPHVLIVYWILAKTTENTIYVYKHYIIYIIYIY